MDDEARPPGGLDAKGTVHNRNAHGNRWGRRTPYGIRRDGVRRDDWRAGTADRAGTTYAALDLGTNNCRLLIARPTASGFRVIDAFSRIIRLGEGVAASRRISEAAIARAVEALLVCRDKMRSRGVVRARLIATEACRAAENGAEFRARVTQEAGLELEIIDSATEARLAATGCTELFDVAASGVILFDIGGGSSELVRLNRAGGDAQSGRRDRGRSIRGAAHLAVAATRPLAFASARRKAVAKPRVLIHPKCLSRPKSGRRDFRSRKL